MEVLQTGSCDARDVTRARPVEASLGQFMLNMKSDIRTKGVLVLVMLIGRIWLSFENGRVSIKIWLGQTYLTEFGQGF
jgi:hypothetical protein